MQGPTDLKVGQVQPASPIDERAYPSWPGIPVLVFSIAAVIAGVLLIRGGGATRNWTAVAIFILGAARLRWPERHFPRTGEGRTALRWLPGDGP